MKTPHASFVIPAYNASAYLAETVNSCLKQTQRRFEVIIVDDGSTDSTRELMAWFAGKDERVKTVFLEKNMGRSAARNRGIQEAKSDLILTLDSDDINIPDRVAQTTAYFKKNPRVHIAYSRFHNIDEWGGLYTYQKDGQELAEIDAVPFDIERTKKNLFTGICHSSMAFRKKVFEKVQYTEGDFCKHGIDDWKFQIDAFKAGFKFGTIHRCLVQYRAVKKKRDEEKIKEMKKACLEGL